MKSIFRFFVPSLIILFQLSSAVFGQSQFQDGVIYKNKQIDNEASFTLFDEDINYSHYAYANETNNLFLLTPSGVKQYDLNNIDQNSPRITNIPIKIKLHEYGNGIAVNDAGTYLALLDNENNIRIISVAEKKEVNTIKLKKKQYNFFSRDPKTNIGNPFVFISNNEIFIAGNKYAGVLDVYTGKTKHYSLSGTDDYPAINVTSNMRITKRPNLYYLNEGMSEFAVLDDAGAIETPNFVGTVDKKNGVLQYSKVNITRKKDNTIIPTAHVGSKNDFILFDDKKMAYINNNRIKPFAGDSVFMTLPDIHQLFYINDYKYLLGIKAVDAKNLGFSIFNYENVLNELEKQYFLEAQSRDEYLAYEDYLNIYPNSIYKNICIEQLDAFYKEEYNNILAKKKLENIIPLLYAYVNEYPNSNYKLAAEGVVENIYETKFKEVVAKNNVKDYEAYISEFPESKYGEQLRKKADDIYKAEFDKACAKNEIDSYQAYIAAYPLSNYIEQITTKKAKRQKEMNYALGKAAYNAGNYYQALEFFTGAEQHADIEEWKQKCKKKLCWEKTYGGDKTSKAFSIVETDDGGAVFVGKKSWKENDSYYTAAWIKKIKANGDDEWEKYYGGKTTYVAYKIIKTADGGFAVAGRKNSKNSSGSWINYLWFIKLDKNGETEWEKFFENRIGANDMDDGIAGLIQTRDGGFAITSRSTNEDYDNYSTTMRFDGKGDLLWEYKYAEGNRHRASTCDIIEDSNGDFLCVGSEDSRSGHYDVLLLRRDKNGKKKNMFHLNGADKDYDAGKSITRASGNTYIIACIETMNDHYVTNIVKLSSSDKLEWSVNFETSVFNIPYSIIRSSDGGFVYVGTIKDKSDPSSYKLLIRKLDKNGKSLWVRKYGDGFTISDGFSIVETKLDKGFFVAGTTEKNNSGNPKAWILRLDENGNLNK